MLHEIDLSRTDLNLLVLFETVLQERHVGRAADRLNLSPSAVSHGLRRLRTLLNDPLFVRTPRGVVPSDRAVALAAPIGEVLARVRAVLESAEPFDPATSRRRFTIGAPDGVSAVFLAPLLGPLRQAAPGLDISLRQLLPAQGEPEPERAWRAAFTALDARAMDVAVMPVEDIPARFHRRLLYEEDFVLAARAGHPFVRQATLDGYCAAQHLVVSLDGDPHGFVDNVLAAQGRSRRVALTGPNFMFALAVLAESDLLCALPRRFAERYAARLGVALVAPPLPLGRFRLSAIAPAAALMDVGLQWLLDALSASTGDLRSPA
jgi:DNA-binding transcriptional LysR family regulator